MTKGDHGRIEQTHREQVEIDYWLKSPTEAPGAETLENLLNKMTDAPVLLERLAPFRKVFEQAQVIVEVGGGQGWASCLLKRMYPQARVIATDISPHAIASIGTWEHAFGSKVDETHACSSYQLPLTDASVDVVFCFAAAHHFGALRRTLAELKRVLRKGGHAFWFHEPACRRWIYKRAYRRVNRIRPDVHEDVLIYLEIVELAREAGLALTCHPDTSLLKRGGVESIYYFVLGKCPPLQSLLPCTRDFEFVNG